MSVGWSATLLGEVYTRMVRAGAEFVVIGGQAINLWAEHYRQTGLFPVEVWTDLLPFTSRDLDCLGGSLDAAKVGAAFNIEPHVYPLFGKAWTPVAADLWLPVNGQILQVEFFHSVRGLSSSEVEEKARELTWAGVALRVQHPAQCLEGKLVNVCELDQRDPPRHDLKHAKLATLILHAFVRERLVAGKIREVLGWTERIMRLAGNQHGLTVWHEHGLDVTEALPLAALQQTAGEEKIARFLELRWDQLQAKLTDRRNHFANGARMRGMEPHPPTPLLSQFSAAVVPASTYLIPPEEPVAEVDGQGHSPPF